MMDSLFSGSFCSGKSRFLSLHNPPITAGVLNHEIGLLDRKEHGDIGL